MKKGVNYLLVFVVGIFVFVACSDYKYESYKTLSSSYRNDRLNFTLNNEIIPDKSVSLEALSKVTGHLVLNNIITSKDSLIVNVVLEDMEKGNFSFSGVNMTDERSISVTGQVTDGVMTLKAEYKNLPKDTIE